MALKGISKIYLEQGLLKGAQFMSYKRSLREGSGNNGKVVGDEFEVFTPLAGVVSVSVLKDSEVGSKIRPKAFTAIEVVDPYIVPRFVVKGKDGSKKVTIEYNLWAEGIKLVGENK